MPELIAHLLLSEAFLVAARVVLTSFFWIAGIYGLFNFGSMVKVIELNNLPMPMPKLIVSLMIVTELVGSGLLITDFNSLGWIGAGALGCFTLLSIPLGHPFWRYQEPKKMEEFQIALEHIGLIGGLMCAAALTVF